MAAEQCDVNRLNEICKLVENMQKIRQIEVLRILTSQKNPPIVVNENKYGVHINLSEVPPNILTELVRYVNYVTTQEHELDNIERMQDEFKTQISKNIKTSNHI